MYIYIQYVAYLMNMHLRASLHVRTWRPIQGFSASVSAPLLTQIRILLGRVVPIASVIHSF